MFVYLKELADYSYNELLSMYYFIILSTFIQAPLLQMLKYNRGIKPYSVDAIKKSSKILEKQLFPSKQAAQVKAELVKAENKKDSDFFIVFN